VHSELPVLYMLFWKAWCRLFSVISVNMWRNLPIIWGHCSTSD